MISQKHETERQHRNGASTSTKSIRQILKHSLPEPTTIHPSAIGRQVPHPWRKSALIGVKVVHSLIYFSIECCMGYLIYTGLKGQEDRRTAIAAGVVVLLQD